MHNVQESDWAEEGWCAHTGMDSSSDYCYETPQKNKKEKPLTLEERLKKKIEQDRKMCNNINDVEENKT